METNKKTYTKKVTWGGYREGSGRKPIADKPLKTRSIRMTDDEYIKIKEYLKSIR
jgi:hypothetical protein